MDREIRAGSVSKQWLPKSGHREPLTKRDYILMRPLTSKGHQDHSLARAKRTTSHQITLSCMKQNCTGQKFSKLHVELLQCSITPKTSTTALSTLLSLAILFPVTAMNSLPCDKLQSFFAPTGHSASNILQT